MDLIYTTPKMVDVGVLQKYQFDLAFGTDENNFECTITDSDHCCDTGYYLHIDDTEYGGIIDAVKVDTEQGQVIYSGRTWHGILGSKIIVPLLEGEASTSLVTLKTVDAEDASMVDRYLVISGDANDCIRWLLERLGLTELFEVRGSAGANVSNYQFYRYVDAYSGISKMLDSVSMRLGVEYENGKVVLRAVAQYDYADDEEFDPSQVQLQIKKNSAAVNHLICLGAGELEERKVVHLYADADGKISETQTLFGLQEYTDIYDYSAVESEEELIKGGKDRLKELREPSSISIALDDTSDRYNVGDRVGAYDDITGLSASGAIKKKIVTIADGQTTISYEVGE